jgi:hypothetical protein
MSAAMQAKFFERFRRRPSSGRVDVKSGLLSSPRRTRISAASGGALPGGPLLRDQRDRPAPASATAATISVCWPTGPSEVYGAKYGKEGLRLTNDAYGVLRSHSWPGNVRELENVLQRAILSPRDGRWRRSTWPLLSRPEGTRGRRRGGETLENVGESPGREGDDRESAHEARWRRQDAASLLGIRADPAYR